MSQVRQQLLAALPLYLDKRPDAVPALQVFHPSAPATVTIAHRQLTTHGANGVATSVALDLTEHTLDSVAAALTAAGYVATVLADDGTVSALSLMDVDRLNLATPVTLQRFTSLLWRAVVAPIAWALEEGYAQVQRGLLQTSVPTAAQRWLDLWGGTYYGGVHRLIGEADRPYADRLIREVLRLRLNNSALERILLEDLGAHARVSNLHDQAWVVAVTPIQYLAGRKYSRTTFEVLVDLIAEEVARIVDRNRAAGTLPFYRFEEVVGSLTDTEVAYGSLEGVGEVAALGPNRVWTVARDPLSQVGLALSRPADLESHLTATRLVELEAPYVITGEAASTPFQLDVSELDGPHILLP